MKELIYATLALFFPFLTMAQNNEGEIVFEETVQLHIEFDGPEEVKAMLPTSQSNTKKLSFNSREAVYKDVDPADNEKTIEAGSEDGGMQMKFVMMRADNQLYINLGDKKTVEQRDFMGKKFLIKGESTAKQWKVTGEQKTILGYTCMKAILQDTSRNAAAWFTPQIPVSLGPDGLNGLPGLILEYNDTKNERTIVATKAEMKPLAADAIEQPTKGKVVTREEFERIVEEKSKEMEAEMGGEGHGMKIEIRN